ncbi:hypothetical protein BC332_11662 [Capsicum chinense]|nr:hypothetical protein BC332_11662 [Capsicum chinense]
MAPGVQLHIQDDLHVVMDNGILQVTLAVPDGIVTGITYNGIDNLLEVRNNETNRGYWDVVWNSTGTKGKFERLKCTTYKVILETDDQIELSFSRTWDVSLQGKLIPLNIDKRTSFATFKRDILLSNLERRPGFITWPWQITGRDVDDKYQYSCDNKDNKVHGWISMDPPVGFWQITPSDEFRSGGPVKQDLTSHVGPTTLAIFLSPHYAGRDLIPRFAQGEAWKKVFGPVFIYVNSGMQGEDPVALWYDAKIQMQHEVQSWPYSFPASEDFPSADQRGSVSGKLLVQDKYIIDEHIPANGAYVGLAPPGKAGSWQRECKDYQFWAKSDDNGCFSINNIRPGDYNIYAWVPGFIGYYLYETPICITPGCNIDVDEIVYQPPRDGPTLWEIGIPDRTAAEFFVPEPNPKFINKLFVNHPDRFRQYGLWHRYSELYPTDDLVYVTGESDYSKDWFFAQVPRIKEDGTYQGTTWQIRFKLDSVNQGGTYKLRIAIASATSAEVQVWVNNPSTSRPLFTTGLIGRDNSIARHGVHGLYWLYNIDIGGIS